MSVRKVAPERIVALARSGKFTTQQCIATAVGLSRQRVSRVLAVRSVRFGRQSRQPNTLISWPCPKCGATVEMWTVRRNTRKTAYCAACAQRRRKEFCLRGHRRIEGRKGKECNECMNRTVEVRHCADCWNELAISYRHMSQIKNGHAVGLRCKACQGRRAGAMSRERRREQVTKYDKQLRKE